MTGTRTDSAAEASPLSWIERRHRRVPFAFEVIVESEDRALLGHCQRVAPSALFVYALDPMATGTRVVLRFSLPSDPRVLVVQGRVLRTLREDPTQNTLGGMYVLFEETDAELEDRIHRFVLRCIRRARAYDRRAAEAGDAPGPDVIPVRYFGTDFSPGWYVVNISEGGAFVRTPCPRPVGSEVLLDLYVPGGAEVLRVPARVVWTRTPDAADPRGAGMGLAFTATDERLTASIRSFVETFGVDRPA